MAYCNYKTIGAVQEEFQNTIQELDKLFSVVNYIFKQCELQLNNLVIA